MDKLSRIKFVDCEVVVVVVLGTGSGAIGASNVLAELEEFDGLVVLT